jgi:glycine oxidase
MGAPIYLVPRSDGSVLLGATSEELGFDTSVTAGGLHDLLRRAHRLVPGVSEMVLVDASAGLRPATPDNAPVLAASGAGSGVDGLIVATGHYRNGILLTPISAVAVAAWLTGSEPPAAILPFGAERFGVGAH